jgi:V8-like Glu-specific endopeptidase
MKGIIALQLMTTLLLTGCGKKTIDLNGEKFEIRKGDVIYGSDGRTELGFHPDSMMRELAKSTAVQINTSSMTKRSGGLTLLDDTPLYKKAGICESEKFATQSAAGRCSGFLVAPDLLVTAGHCMTSQRDCTSNSWVFDYSTSSNSVRISSVDSSKVYSCSRIISQKLDGGRGVDFALVQLDRPVLDRSPLKFRTSGKAPSSASLVVIGNPSGLPTKITDGGKIRDNSHPVYMVGTLDTFQGNSGSAVINEQTGEVEGILVRGDTDYVYDYSKGCKVVNKCSEFGCRGEDVTRITVIKKLLEIASSSSPSPQEGGLGGGIFFEDTSLGIELKDHQIAEFPFEITDKASLKDLKLGLTIHHSYVGDLIIGLLHPNGTVVVLRDKFGGAKKDLEVVYDSKTNAELKKFVGLSVVGKWKVLIKDTASRDEGTLTGIKLEMK